MIKYFFKHLLIILIVCIIMFFFDFIYGELPLKIVRQYMKFDEIEFREIIFKDKIINENLRVVLITDDDLSYLHPNNIKNLEKDQVVRMIFPTVSFFEDFEKECKEHLHPNFLKNADYVIVYLNLHGGYDVKNNYVLSTEKSDVIQFEEVGKILVRYLGHIPLIVFALGCYGNYAQTLLLELKPSSVVVTFSDWFTLTSIYKELFLYFSKHPLLIMQALCGINYSSVRTYGNLFIIGYKNKQNLVEFKYYKNQGKKKDCVIEGYSKKESSDFFKRLSKFRKNYLKTLDEISCEKTFTKQSEMMASLNIKSQEFLFQENDYIIKFREMEAMLEKTDSEQRDVTEDYSKPKYKHCKNAYKFFTNCFPHESRFLFKNFKETFLRKLSPDIISWDKNNILLYKKQFIDTYKELVDPYIVLKLYDESHDFLFEKHNLKKFSNLLYFPKYILYLLENDDYDEDDYDEDDYDKKTEGYESEDNENKDDGNGDDEND